MPLVADLRMGKWVPGVTWVKEEQNFHTRVVWASSLGTRHSQGRVMAKIHLFANGKEAPDYSYTTPSIPFGQSHSLDVAALLNQNGDAKNFEGYAIVQAWAPDEEEGFACLMETWTYYFSDDGKMYCSVPVLPAIGARRVPVPGRCITETFPGIISNKEFATRVVWMYPYKKPNKLTYRVYNKKGEYLASQPQLLLPRHSGVHDLSNLMPGLDDFLASGGGVGHLMMASSFATRFYIMFIRRRDNLINSMDHSVPYLYFYRQPWMT